MIADGLSALSVVAVPSSRWLRRGRGQRRGAGDPGRIRLTLRPRRHDGPRVDAARGRDPRRWTLDHANSVYEAIFNLAYIVGPGIGGLLIATLGGINTMWVTAASFVLSIVAIAVLRLEGAGPARSRATSRRGLVGHRRGHQFVWHNKVLRTLAFVDLTATGLYMPMEACCSRSTSPTATSPRSWAGC